MRQTLEVDFACESKHLLEAIARQEEAKKKHIAKCIEPFRNHKNASNGILTHYSALSTLLDSGILLLESKFRDQPETNKPLSSLENTS